MAANPRNLWGCVTGLPWGGHVAEGQGQPLWGAWLFSGTPGSTHMALQSSILTQSAISRLYEDWIVFCLWVVTSGDVSQQPGNGLFPLSYIYFILFFFFATVCMHRKSSKNLRLNRKWSVPTQRVPKGMRVGRIRKGIADPNLEARLVHCMQRPLHTFRFIGCTCLWVNLPNCSS